jgi:hypothetical protein
MLASTGGAERAIEVQKGAADKYVYLVDKEIRSLPVRTREVLRCRARPSKEILAEGPSDT